MAIREGRRRKPGQTEQRQNGQMVRWQVSCSCNIQSDPRRSFDFKMIRCLKLVASPWQRDLRRQQAGNAWRPQPLVRSSRQRIAGSSRVQDQTGLPTTFDRFDDAQKDDHVLGGEWLEDQEGQDHFRVQQQPGKGPCRAHKEGGGEAASCVTSPEPAASYARKVASERLVGQLSGG